MHFFSDWRKQLNQLPLVLDILYIDQVMAKQQVGLGNQATTVCFLSNYLEGETFPYLPYLRTH